jgi:hypothetical protein
VEAEDAGDGAAGAGFVSPALQAVLGAVPGLGAGEAVEAIQALLDQVVEVAEEDAGRALGSRKEILGAASGLLNASGRAEALAGALGRRADRGGAPRGLSAATWLSQAYLLTRSQASRVLLAAGDLETVPEVRAKVLAGEVGPARGRAAAKTLQKLGEAGLTRGSCRRRNVCWARWPGSWTRPG